MKRKWRWLGLSVAAPVVGVVILARHIDAFGQCDEAKSNLEVDAIIVLGARVLAGGGASNTLRERTWHAVNLYRSGVGEFLICTGGVGQNPPSEGEVAAQLAQRRGVPKSRIEIENRSTSTRENLQFASEICRRRGWKRVVLVSQGFHLFRAKRDAQNFGLNAFTSPVPNANIDFQPLVKWRWTVRESVLWLRDVVLSALKI